MGTTPSSASATCSPRSRPVGTCAYFSRVGAAAVGVVLHRADMLEMAGRDRAVDVRRAPAMARPTAAFPRRVPWSAAKSARGRQGRRRESEPCDSASRQNSRRPQLSCARAARHGSLENIAFPCRSVQRPLRLHHMIHEDYLRFDGCERFEGVRPLKFPEFGALRNRRMRFSTCAFSLSLIGFILVGMELKIEN